MPVPKKKTSRMRRGNRRSHDSLTPPATQECPSCGAIKAPHRVCDACGTYRDTEVFETDEL